MTALSYALLVYRLLTAVSNYATHNSAKAHLPEAT